MGVNYEHTLIAGRPDFVPDPEQVCEFLEALVAIGAAPLEPTITVSKLSGEVRFIPNPLKSGTLYCREMREWWKVNDLAELPSALKGLEYYNVSFNGRGPPKVPPFPFELDYQDEYDFLVQCCLREEVVSTSHWNDEIRRDNEVRREPKAEPFGRPCSPRDRVGIFHRPKDLAIIEVPNAGCARFWVAFECGRLFPPIEDRLDLLDAAIVRAAEREFGVDFVQGCRWSA
jgi:hypothetical protein